MVKRYCSHCGEEVEFKEYSGNETAMLQGNSHAELRDSSHANLWENSHAECQSPYACAILKSSHAQCIGQSFGGKIISPREYLKACGVSLKNQYTVLYKSVTKTGYDHKTEKIKYEIGKEVIAPDWDVKSTGECGKGLHLSPSVGQAIMFNDSCAYLACRVNIKDIASLPAFAQYPDKIRVRACTPLYKVDKDGKKID